MTSAAKEVARDIAVVVSLAGALFGGLLWWLGPPPMVEAATHPHVVVWLGCSEDGEHWHRVGPSESIQGFIAMARREPGCRVLRMELDGPAPEAPPDALPATPQQQEAP